MSPALRKLSPRDTSAAISAADRLWPGRECAGGGEVVRDLPGGAACSSAGAGEETGDAASTARAVWPGAAIAGGRGAGGLSHLRPGSAPRPTVFPLLSTRASPL